MKYIIRIDFTLFLLTFFLNVTTNNLKLVYLALYFYWIELV